MRRSFFLVVLISCGGTKEPPAPRSGPAASLVAAPSGTEDVVVAQVNDKPVWGSCVAAQVAAGAPDRRTALAQCVDFELLAQAADQRGLAGDPEVAEAARRALVSRVITIGFEDTYRTPEDLPRRVTDQIIERNRAQMDKPELRGSAFVRVEVPAGAPPETEQQARALADKIAGALANETGLFPVHVFETATRLAEGSGFKITTGTFRTAAVEAVVKQYGDALFAIPEVGRISRPARTQWGWDVILLTELLPPKVYTREEVLAKVFPDLRRQYFLYWVNQLTKSLGLQVQVNAQLLTDEGAQP